MEAASPLVVDPVRGLQFSRTVFAAWNRECNSSFGDFPGQPVGSISFPAQLRVKGFDLSKLNVILKSQYPGSCRWSCRLTTPGGKYSCQMKTPRGNPLATSNPCPFLRPPVQVFLLLFFPSQHNDWKCQQCTFINNFTECFSYEWCHTFECSWW